MIKDIYQRGKTVFSLEVFPPKTDDDVALIFKALDELKKLKLDFISITYGAGGSTSKRTLDIASYVQNTCGIEALAHFTCVALNEELFYRFLEALRVSNIRNVLALRGDRPQDMSDETYLNRPYKYARELVSLLRQNTDFCIGGACYPEIHPESGNLKNDLRFLKAKVDAGIDFLITQLFFDNDCFYRFSENAGKHGITVPISAGIMPITSARQIHTIVTLSGASIPAALRIIFEKYEDKPEDFKKAGLDYATNQVMKLMEYGAAGIHLYTLNKVDVSTGMFKNLGLL